MLNITINAPRAFSDVELKILTASFEKMSQLATMYECANIQEPMEMYVSIGKGDIEITDVVDNGGRPMLLHCDFTEQEFLQALRLALHTMVSFTIDTNVGQQTTTRSLFPCIMDDSGCVAWQQEPEFIVRLDVNNRLQFELLDDLRRFASYDTSGVQRTTMMVGGVETWSM